MAHVDPQSQEFTDLVNEACRRLMTYGNFWGTVVKRSFTANTHQIVWPPWVGTILAAYTCRHHASVVSGSWTNFEPLSSDDYHMIASHYHSPNSMRGNVAINDYGTSPVSNNIVGGTANTIRVYRRSTDDDDKTIAFFGIGANGYPYSEVITIGLGPGDIGYVDSTGTFQRIDQVVKQPSIAMVDCYQVNPAGTVFNLSHYRGGETSPSYRVSEVHSPQFNLPFSVLIKLKHVDVAEESDVVIIENKAALKLMIQSINSEEGGDVQVAEAHSIRAIHELNRELNDKIPQDQIPIDINMLGTAIPSRHGIGRML